VIRLNDRHRRKKSKSQVTREGFFGGMFRYKKEVSNTIQQYVIKILPHFVFMQNW